MKFLHFPLLGLLGPALLAQGPVLSTPGTATWLTETIGGGYRTTFTITGDTVLDWGNLNLPQGSELIYDFVGGQSVLNYLNGGGYNGIAGNVTSNGHVAFFSPNADLDVTGNITARSVTLSTLDVNPTDFSNGGGYQLSAGAGLNFLTVAGRVEATAGDVVLAGQVIDTSASAFIGASGAVRVAAAGSATIAGSGQHRVTTGVGDGFFFHSGAILAPDIEVSATNEVAVQGRLGESGARVFVEVGPSGSILTEANAIIVNDAVFSGTVRQAPRLSPKEADGAAIIGDAVLRIPTLSRPDGTKVSAGGKLSYSSPMSASGDGGRDAEAKKRRTAEASNRRSLVQRSSFFGMRGGSAQVTTGR